ncbi:MAG: nucleotidyltransferase domain-containing protein [bacterium]
MNKIELALEFTDDLHEILGDNLVSAFLYGSVARGDDGPDSDINVFAVTDRGVPRKLLTALGEFDRWGSLSGEGKFSDIRCLPRERGDFISDLRRGLPREAYNPLKEAMILFDTDFVRTLKERLMSGEIKLCPFPWVHYLYYGDEALGEILRAGGNVSHREFLNAMSFYLQAYLNLKYREVLTSKYSIVGAMARDNLEYAELYERIWKEKRVSLPALFKVKCWVEKRISFLI